MKSLNLGGLIRGLAVDAAGNAFFGGNGKTVGTTAGAFKITNPDPSGLDSAYVAKLNPTGTAMTYASYIADIELRGIAIDSGGNVYATGTSSSNDFPLLSTSSTDPIGVFVTKLNSAGTSLIYASTIGKGWAPDIAASSSGEVFVAGTTDDDAFPTTSGVFQPQKGWPNQLIWTGFVTKLNSSGAVIYSTFLGGVACNCSDQLYRSQDEILSLRIDTAGYAYVGGATRSTKFHSVDGLNVGVSPIAVADATWPFVVKITPLGDRLVYATKVGAKVRSSRVTALAVDGQGGVFALGNIHNHGDGAYADYVNTILLGAGAPALPTGTATLSYILKLALGKNNTTIRKPTDHAVAGQPLTMIADVQNPKTGGFITFSNGTTSLGTAPVVDGAATLTTVLSKGAHKITATYSLDGIESLPVYHIVNSQ